MKRKEDKFISNSKDDNYENRKTNLNINNDTQIENHKKSKKLGNRNVIDSKTLLNQKNEELKQLTNVKKQYELSNNGSPKELSLRKNTDDLRKQKKYKSKRNNNTSEKGLSNSKTINKDDEEINIQQINEFYINGDIDETSKKELLIKIEVIIKRHLIRNLKSIKKRK